MTKVGELIALLMQVPNHEAEVRVRSTPGPTAPTVTATASTDLVNSTGHGFKAGDRVLFTRLVGGAGLAVNTVYFVIASGLTANAFKLSATKGGSAIDITTDVTAAELVPAKDAASSVVDRSAAASTTVSSQAGYVLIDG